MANSQIAFWNEDSMMLSDDGQDAAYRASGLMDAGLSALLDEDLEMLASLAATTLDVASAEAGSVETDTIFWGAVLNIANAERSRRRQEIRELEQLYFER